jgi:hypothetical protein
MLLQDISQIDPLPRHPVRNHRDRDQEPNPVHGWNGKPEVIALFENLLIPMINVLSDEAERVGAIPLKNGKPKP